MRTVPIVAALALSAVLLGGCGSSNPIAGHSLAADACRSSGQQAATLASRAAAQNSTYATLSADEAALLASERSQTGELSDGNGSDDSGLGALEGADSIGSGSDIKVISDCTSLGLPVSPK